MTQFEIDKLVGSICVRIDSAARSRVSDSGAAVRISPRNPGTAKMEDPLKAHRFVFVISVVLAFLLVLPYPAAANASEEWQVVRVTDDEAMVEVCVLIGEVKGKSSYGGLLAQNVGEERAYKHLKRNAWEMGGNTVLLLFGRSGFGGSKYRGEAYRCDDPSGEVPESIVLGGVTLCGPREGSVAYLSATVDEDVETSTQHRGLQL